MSPSLPWWRPAPNRPPCPHLPAWGLNHRGPALQVSARGRRGRSIDRDVDVLHLGIVRQSLQPFFAAEAALLIAAKGGRYAAAEEVVNVDLAGFDAGCQRVCFADVPRPDACHQSVRVIIGHLERFFGLAER